MIDSSIYDKIKLMFEFDISKDGKQLIKIKQSQRRDTSTIDVHNEIQILREVIIESSWLKREVI